MGRPTEPSRFRPLPPPDDPQQQGARPATTCCFATGWPGPPPSVPPPRTDPPSPPQREVVLALQAPGGCAACSRSEDGEGRRATGPRRPGRPGAGWPPDPPCAPCSSAIEGLPQNQVGPRQQPADSETWAEPLGIEAARFLGCTFVTHGAGAEGSGPSQGKARHAGQCVPAHALADLASQLQPRLCCHGAASAPVLQTAPNSGTGNPLPSLPAAPHGRAWEGLSRALSLTPSCPTPGLSLPPGAASSVLVSWESPWSEAEPEGDQG